MNINAIDNFCDSVITACINASINCIPTTRSRATHVTLKHVKPERERSLLWHWIWLESGKPNKGFIYEIMKRTRHQYHYAVRCCKKNKLNIQKQKLADSVSNSTEFWKEVNKPNTTHTISTLTMDDANGENNITELLLNKYETLYNSVPTSGAELSSIKDIVNEGDY